MIASLLAFVSLAVASVHVLLLMSGRNPVRSQIRRDVLVAAPPAVLVLASTAQLNWSILQALPYVVGASLGAVLLLRLAPVRSTPASGVALAQSAWMLTCLGAVTAERLYRGAGQGQAVWAVLGLMVFALASWFGARWRSTPPAQLGAIVAAVGCVGIVLPLVPGIGVDINGARGWVQIGPLLGQPGEIARVFIVVGIGLMLCAAGPALRFGRIAPACLACSPFLVAAAIGAYTADFGPVLVLGAAVGAMVLLCRPRPRHALVLVAAAGGVTFALMMGVSRLRARVEQMLHPATPAGDLHNTGAALRAFANGGLFGRGFGDGDPHAIANVENDFVLAAVAEERGLVGIVAVLILFGVLTTACWTVALRATSEGPRLSAAGLVSMLTVQALYVASATLTVVPVTGMVVPFLSHGGSALVGMWISIGLVLGIGSHPVVPPTGGTSGAKLAHRMTSASRISAAAWAVVAVIATVVVTTQPVAASSTSQTRWKSALVTRDGTTLISATNERQPDRSPVAQTAFAPDLVNFVDNATGQQSCTKSWLQSFVAGQCIPQPVVTSLRDSVQGAVEASMTVPGDAVGLDLHSGEVIALYERPRPNTSGGIATLSPVERPSAPGSTFKTVTAAAALSHGIDGSTPQREIYTPPGGVGDVVNAWRGPGGGSLPTALAESSNTAFAEIAIRAGGPVLTETAEMLSSWYRWGTDDHGLGIDVGPNLDDPDVLARSGFGQEGVRATPLAMAVVAGKIASGGTSPNPTLEAGTCSRSGQFVAKTPLADDSWTIGDHVTDPIREGMTRAVTEGHSGVLDAMSFSVAAKTGTAEDPEGFYDGWVIAYAPVETPRFSVAVRIWADHESLTSRTGAMDAAPVAAALLNAAMNTAETSNPCTSE
ncbi:FtsW/RodA/SpoVE family cell cycle protein [Rhodococcus sp. LW-XY12]|uniref:FtsW/RodA/SpoVE family cell cycle protein n=1 Tax=Rhodococcus sp. LW-XY12 TaxID=2856851 RepID=UPI001C55A029|nr:FtsW/RodA/SpoVE family cell cycle protein [Rhodococcus sp. LW-XY12]QXU56634.1 FtsW/RodA/SpoVE family cell cycle protein [Rhodococcus sp. LW-XY12]